MKLMGKTTAFLSLGLMLFSLPAWAVPVEYVPDITAADVACHGTVNEAALQSALQAWLEEYNSRLASHAAMEERDIVRDLTEEGASILSYLQTTETKGKVEAVAEPVLERWSKAIQDPSVLSADDRKVLDILGRYGMVPAAEEGMAFLTFDYGRFYKHTRLSPECGAFIDILVSQPLSSDALHDDQTLFWGLDSLAEWAVQWEKFLREQPSNPYAPYALKRYHSYIDLMLFCSLPASMTFPAHKGGVMTDWTKEFLENVAELSRGTFTGKIIEEFLAGVKAQGMKEPEGLKQRIATQINAEFSQKKAVQDEKKEKNVSAVLYYEGHGKINGKIPVSLWFDVKAGLASGELVYTATKAKTPIRLLGREEGQDSFRLHEMLPNGDVSGTMKVTLAGGNLSGTWYGRPRVIEKKNNEGFEFKEGKKFSMEITGMERKHPPYRWEFDKKHASGTYAYSFGENYDDGTVWLNIKDDGTAQYRVIGLTGEPSRRAACFPEDALTGESATARLEGNRILIEAEESCAVELMLYNDFLVSSYVTGRDMCSHIGNGATPEGLFLRKK